jgi:hypothetical protein
VNRVAAYLLGAVLASLFYVAWVSVVSLVVTSAVLPKENLQIGLKDGVVFALGFALYYFVFGGFGLALGLVSLPWAIAAWGYRRLRCPGSFYFVAIGACLAFAVGCATAALSWKPLFIEDNTFWGYASVAAERQGVCFLLAGALLGYAYWFLSERAAAARGNPEN